jgi:HNH endonuclease/NUMOD4 motif/NUMOD1 domain
MTQIVFSKFIPGFSGDYLASEDGQIYSKKSGDIKRMKKNTNSSGYHTISLYNKHEKERLKNKRNSYMYQVHRLVALTWLENPNSKKIVNHIDGNKINNNVSNLEWVTHSENSRHSRDVLGNKSYTRSVIQKKLDGTFVKKYQSMKEAEISTGINSRSICSVAQGKRRHSGGFCWVYEEDFKEGVPMRRLVQCKKVDQYSKNNKYIKTFPSLKEAAEEVGALPSNITNACIGRLKTSKGYIWKYSKIIKEEDETKDWVGLEKYPNDKISKDGRVYSTWVKRMKTQRDRKGYKLVSITNKDGKEIKIGAHRLVAMAYLPNPQSFPMVNHIDGNPSNNNVTNLEWCDASHNSKHAHRTGLCSSRKKVNQLDKNGKVIRTFNSMAEAAEFTGAHKDGISHVCRKVPRCKTAGGYGWEYTE